MSDSEYEIMALDEHGEVLFSVTEKKGLVESYFLENTLDFYSLYINIFIFYYIYHQNYLKY
ncbi:hypothetical protein Echvi_2543 [Echinicola vietnamensis DSM 17526]|uniref:Uncharacterized protein n=1 Tax=Echinicola vietnamensis (strain DSM 17526 / LMG 23754 / KMM 6221) TaxID=926556 RepID=L0FXZ6_ECHVK|nr:hypothetical protein Echvi_2543 [Echinicola vietnamensis DSM 17526]